MIGWGAYFGLSGFTLEFLYTRIVNQELHLLYRDLVELFEAVALFPPFLDEQCVEVFHVRQADELGHIGLVPEVSLRIGILRPPCSRCFPEECHIQHVRLGRIDQVDLFRGQRNWNQVLLYGVCMDAIVYLREVSIDVPAELCVFSLFQALELFDELDLEFWTDPHPKLEGDIFMCVCPAVPTNAGYQPYRIGFRLPILDADLIAVQSSLTSNYGEFAIIKIWIVYPLLDSEKLHCIPISKPVGNEKISVFCVEHVRQRNVIFTVHRNEGNIRIYDSHLAPFGHACLQIVFSFALRPSADLKDLAGGVGVLIPPTL